MLQIYDYASEKTNYFDYFFPQKLIIRINLLLPNSFRGVICPQRYGFNFKRTNNWKNLLPDTLVIYAIWSFRLVAE